MNTLKWKVWSRYLALYLGKRLNRCDPKRLKRYLGIFCLVGTMATLFLLHKAWKAPKDAVDFPVKQYPLPIDSLPKYNPKTIIHHER